MIVNTLMGAILCKSCMIALRPNEVQGHLDGEHPRCKMTVDEDQLDKVVEEMDICPELPLPPFGVGSMPEFEGLKLQSGFRCGECPRVMGTSGSAAKHYSTEHKGIKKPKNLQQVYFQQWNKGGGINRTLFEVSPRNKKQETPDEQLVAVLRAQTDKVFATNIDPGLLNARGISPWLLSCQWHLHLATYDPAELMELVRPLREKEMSRLVVLVHRYYLEATDLIKHTDDLTLQHLNTPDPAKTYVNLYMLRFTFSLFDTGVSATLHSIIFNSQPH